MRENIIISDLHGCIDEFNELLDNIKYDVKKHRLISCGDILDRGANPVGLLQQIRKMKLECVISNHEQKAYRWRKYELRKKLTGEDNPIKTPSDRRKAEWEALAQEDLRWIAELPVKINIKDNWYTVHAGMEPCIPFDKQDPEKIIRVRYVDKNGSSTKDKQAIFWADAWEQPYNLIFGHTVHTKPTKYTNINNTCIAIDTGCVYGGSLTGFNLDRNEFVQVKAKKKYYGTR